MRHAADASRWPVRDEVAPLVAEHRGVLFFPLPTAVPPPTYPVPPLAHLERESEERGRLGDGFSSGSFSYGFASPLPQPHSLTPSPRMPCLFCSNGFLTYPFKSTATPPPGTLLQLLSLAYKPTLRAIHSNSRPPLRPIVIGVRTRQSKSSYL